jgi:very-short-patch-repair endonuclease
LRDPEAPSSSEEGVGGGGPTRRVLLERAARMRQEPTEPELRLWYELRNSRLAGHKFRRQAIIGARNVDFFCPAKGLIVEVDGDTHDRERDLKRDRSTERRTGFATVRFSNEEVMQNIDGVLTNLLMALQGRPDRWGNGGCTTPQPPPLKRRGSRLRDPEARSSSEEGVGGGGP